MKAILITTVSHGRHTAFLIIARDEALILVRSVPNIRGLLEIAQIPK
jgi:hypothetical protein